ncbi:MAG: hypothetical protein H0X51_04650 [Parachlamydiaceae bacterium]|nr:hypothetical protein [Parachlamydiaceae bacterium]
MQKQDDEFFDIAPLFETSNEEHSSTFYRETIRNILKRILPVNVLPKGEDPDHTAEQRKEFFALLPHFFSTKIEHAPSVMSFCMLSKLRPNAFRFFFDMISNWLVPGKRLNILQFYAVDFRFPAFGEDIFTLCEVRLYIETAKELEILERNLPILDTELRLGMRSSYYARRIMEVKGLTADVKTATIQEYIVSLISRFPKAFDHDLLTEMQLVLVMCREDFKAIRESRHLSRIISVHYLFRKELRKAVKEHADRRHLNLKIFRSSLHLSNHLKPVLGMLVGVNFLRANETFEERHLIGSIQNYIPSAKVVENSFFSNRRGNEEICTLYLELEKEDGERFSTQEIRLLQQELPSDLKDRIEHLMHPIFMPRNEEEIMRNILSLSNQIKYLHDLPQVIISFDKQTNSELVFNVILVRICKPTMNSIQEKFKATPSSLIYVHDRSKVVGYLRKTYPKEATVFGVKLQKNQFLRRDHSIDLNKARQTVIAELTHVVGEVRDFNGGMISKQHELLCAVRGQLNGFKYNELMLENFFYSLTPDVMRTVLDPTLLTTLFNLLLESLDNSLLRGEKHSLRIRFGASCVFAMIKAEDRSIKEHLAKALHRFDYQGGHMASSFVLVYDVAYLGYIYLSDVRRNQEAFYEFLQANLSLLTPIPSCSFYQSLLIDKD